MKENEISHPMPSDATEFTVTAADLPLHCPMDAASAWASHPRVFLPIDEKVGAEYCCPYCGAKYTFS